MFTIRPSRLLLFVCALALGTAFLSAEDAWVRSFVVRARNRHVVYDGNNLALYASPSVLVTALACLMSGGALLGCASILCSADSELPDDTVCSGSPFANRVTGMSVFTACGGTSGAVFWDNLRRHLQTVAYFTFNDRGLWEDGVFKFQWSDVVDIECKTEDVSDSGYEIRIVSIFGNGRKKLMNDVHEIFLPISIDRFAALVEHYQEIYREKQA